MFLNILLQVDDVLTSSGIISKIADFILEHGPGLIAVVFLAVSIFLVYLLNKKIEESNKYKYIRNNDNQIFISTKYGKHIYEVSLSKDIKLFDYRKLRDENYWELNESSYGYKLYNDLYSGKYDKYIPKKYKSLYDDNYEYYEYDELYINISFGDYSTIEDVWFYEWLKNNDYDGGYVTKTKTLNLFIFNTKKIESIRMLQ